jgi:heterodisulfide reductase subunit A-like polyferredoxin
VLDQTEEVQSEVFQDVLHAALDLQKTASSEVWVLARQIQVALQGQEELYDRCREAGVAFVKYEDEVQISSHDGHVELLVVDAQAGVRLTISDPDTLIVPQKAVLSSSALEFAQSLSIRILHDRYTQPDSLWRLPNETNRPGIFAVGSSRGNMDYQAILDDAASVARSVKERLKPEGIPVKAHIPVVDKGKCVYCLTCVRTCPFGAMQRGKAQGMAASVNRLACQACGVCIAVCPAGALQLRDEIVDFGLQNAD